LKKILSGQCPCGYIFGTFNDVKDAIVAVKSHFELFHKDFLPFGITDSEALTLVKKGIGYGKKMVSANNFGHLRLNRRIAQQNNLISTCTNGHCKMNG
jgi:hypothetical protein